MSAMNADGSLWGSLLATAAALAFVLALAWISLRVLRGRLVAGAGDRAARVPRLDVLRQWPLGPREKLVLIEVRGEQCLLGVTAGGMQMLARWPLDETADAVDAEGQDQGKECGQP